MRKKSVIALIFIGFLLLTLLVISNENQPHAFTQCSSCHIQPNPAKSGAEAREMNAPITEICNKCHEKGLSEGYMHPYDVKPQRVFIPADMPLSPSGELTCSTCHDVHADYTTPYGAPTHFLRRGESGEAFCKICHGNLNALSSGHSASLGEAHFRSQYVVTDSSQEIDAMSRNCISCHDGTYATSVTIRVGTWKHQMGFMRHDQNSHPIGIDYESVRINRGAKTDLRPMDIVDPRIKFFNGKIGCGSCHDPYSTIPQQLVMSDENSKLCFACHIV